MVHGFLELEEEFNLARQKIGEVERGSCARHHLLCPITWHPLQSISSHFSQHFLKKPHPSRAHRYLATASPGEGVRTTKRTKRRSKRRSGVTGQTRLGPNTGRRPSRERLTDHARCRVCRCNLLTRSELVPALPIVPLLPINTPFTCATFLP